MKIGIFRSSIEIIEEQDITVSGKKWLHDITAIPLHIYLRGLPKFKRGVGCHNLIFLLTGSEQERKKKYREWLHTEVCIAEIVD